jgi:hypothetical protein
MGDSTRYSISRLKARPGQKLEFRPKTPPPLKTRKMTHEQDMKAALAELEASSKPNYTEIAEKYKLGRHALSLRHQGKTTSQADYFSNHRQCLTNIQEEILIDQINRLTDQGMPPTSQMVKNFAEEIIGRAVGKNWARDFCKRHQLVLKSLYLRNIDNQRVKGEYALAYKLFFTLVTLILVLLLGIIVALIANFYVLL